MSVCEYLAGRGVTRLCHFTKIKSLTHILTSESGILAQAFIKSDVASLNDTFRYDNKQEYVNCSIQYPNTWLFSQFQGKDNDLVFRDWVVLFISLAMIDDSKAKFSPCNASKDSGQHIVSDMGRISEIYADNVGRWDRDFTMLMACPTDDQAEILIYRNIPLKYISGIAVVNADIAERISALAITCNYRLPIFISPQLFKRGECSRLVRSGYRPTEQFYNYEG